MQQRILPFDDTDGGPPKAKEGPTALTVSQLTRRIRDLLLKADGLQDILIIGEVSDPTRSGTGHLYFTLKDESSVLSCVMWRSKASGLKFDLENGMKVIAKGSISVYEKGGRYQLYVEQVRPEGIGALHLAFEQLRKRLEAEGLFDEARKRPIPAYPGKVGVVTSPGGAAIQDIIRVATGRWPGAHIIISPASVQGETSAREVVHAIGLLNDLAEVDVIIVSRGGGSLEDLWSFNEEIVARAIAGSRIPVVTGIGHQVDTTIADYVADLAAATPSQAAELVFPDAQELQARLRGMTSTLGFRLKARVRMAKERLGVLMGSRALSRPKELIKEHRLVLDEKMASLVKAMQGLIVGKGQSLALAEASLVQLDPRAILARGYSITLGPDEKVVKDPEQVERDDLIRIIVHRGEITGRVKDRRRGGAHGEEREDR